MKQPSIDAIRRFKEQQERKKLQETERKIQEKLTTLEHRAAQGDRKAKSELKIIEKAKEESIRQPEVRHDDGNLVNGIRYSSNSQKSHKKLSVNDHNGTGKRPKRVETDFDELMRLAASNNNQLRREEVKKPSDPPQRIPSVTKKSREVTSTSSDQNPSRNPPTSQRPTPVQPSTSRPIARPQPTSQLRTSQAPRPQQTLLTSSSQSDKQSLKRTQSFRPKARPNPAQHSNQRRMVARFARNYHASDEYYDDADEDDYEQDDFVVDEDDEETQNEVSKTIRSVFGYDKRRCDLREAELDRQYRQIGRVSTFEDLEREERRASRLAAVEDARAAREEEERKRLKKMRMKGHR